MGSSDVVDVFIALKHSNWKRLGAMPAKIHKIFYEPSSRSNIRIIYGSDEFFKHVSTLV